MRGLRVGLVAGYVLCCSGYALAQQATKVGDIYICIDAKGRRLTSDRPIMDCQDREQRVLNSSGTFKQRIGPVLTAKEQQEQEQAKLAALAEAEKVADEKRRSRALLVRYPNKAAHDKQRAESLATVDATIDAAKKRITELEQQRDDLAAEVKKLGPEAKVPAGLRGRVNNNDQNLKAQRRYLSDQEQERQNLVDKYDDELRKLQQMWSEGKAQ